MGTHGRMAATLFALLCGGSEASTPPSLPPLSPGTVAYSPSPSLPPTPSSPPPLSPGKSTGNPDCPCLTSAQRTAMTGWSKFENADGTTKVTLAGIDYSYPADYGTNTCEVHDAGRDPYCSQNSFDSWFGDNAASDGSHTITDIADLMNG